MQMHLQLPVTLDFKETVETKQIVRLEELHELHVKKLVKMQYSNPNYQDHKLKSKLERHETITREIGILNLLGKNSKEFSAKFN